MDEERKQPGFTLWISVAVIPIAFYLLAFGPICWMNERGVQLGSLNASRVYRPLLALSSRGRLPPPLAWYARLGARKGADPAVEDGCLVWRNHPAGLKMIAPHLRSSGSTTMPIPTTPPDSD